MRLACTPGTERSWTRRLAAESGGDSHGDTAGSGTRDGVEGRVVHRKTEVGGNSETGDGP